MPSIYRSAAVLAFAGAAFANPIKQGDDACLAAVTGKGALGDDNLRKEHCVSFAKTIVTPSAVTVTTTITDAPSAQVTEWSNYKRDVTVCPNEVPNYASACNEAGYKSACSAFGVKGADTTITIPATTSTKTVYVGKGGNGGNGGNNGICISTSTVFATQTAGNGGNNGKGDNGKGGNGGGSTVTKTVTQTEAKATVTVTATADNGNGKGNNDKGDNDKGNDGNGNGNGNRKCLTDAKAKEFTDAFTDLLEYTSYNGTQGKPGRGYKKEVSAKYLAEDFADYSDSINWMAGLPLGGVTFASRAAFDYGQGMLQPELAVKTMMVSHSCNEITWRWQATTQTQASIMGLNHMILNDDLSQIKVNYAEFNNAAWLSSFGLTCKVPTNAGSTSSGSTPAH